MGIYSPHAEHDIGEHKLQHSQNHKNSFMDFTPVMVTHYVARIMTTVCGKSLNDRYIWQDF